MFSRNLLDKIDLRAEGFEFCPEITAKIEKIIRDNAAGISEALLVGPSADDDSGDDEM
jgi:hypothetical protein